jgi:ribosomal-protein-alanine N-acetyltransferase
LVQHWGSALSPFFYLTQHGDLMKHPRTQIENIHILSLYNCNPKDLIDYFKKNKRHLAETMPLRDENFYTADYWNKQITQYVASYKDGKSLCFILQDQKTDKVIGMISFDQMIYGAFRSCYLGYSLDKDYQGKGIMTQALQFGIHYVINELQLNRIMANYMPQNCQSGKLLRRLGFEREGYARKYLKLNGEWRDHVLTSLISD